MKGTITLFWIVCWLGWMPAQNFHRLDVPVTADGQTLINAWAGGLNSPQWSEVDLNNDGKQDIYIFDRNGFVNLGFLNIGNAGESVYQFAPQWVEKFPATKHFVLMRDYNRDGAADFFGYALDTGAPPGIKVYKGRYSGGRLHFDRVLFPQNDFDVIPYQLDGNVFDIELNPLDYPAIDDLDGDGDLDVLVLGVNGDRVNYFENIALESGFTDDSLLYAPGDECWGKFLITPFSQSVDLSTDPDKCGSGQPFITATDRTLLHGGATLATFDADNDGDKEVLYGDLIFSNIVYAKNNGTPEAAWMTEQDTTFPKYDQPVDIPQFAASFFLDVNNDGKQDLIASPNQSVGTPDIETAWFYENKGSDEVPVYELQQKDFLVSSMMDFGSGAYPAFADVNGDSLVDIVIGNRGEWVGEFIDDAYLILLLNVGTAMEPAFEIVDRNWLNFSQFAPATKSFTPAFGDLDGDGDIDLITGDDEGGLFYAENTAGPGEPMAFPNIQVYWKNIFVGRTSTPFIHDINKDGLSDLIIGERNGTVNYLPNIGSTGNPDFHSDPDEAPNNNNFGKVNTQFGGFVGYSSPKILEFDGDMYLLTGSNEGWIMRFRIIPDSINGGAFELLNEKLGNLREGHITSPAFAELNGDMYLDMVIGNDRGGVGIFQSPITIDGLVGAREETLAEEGIRIFPNPAGDFLTVDLDLDQPVIVSYFLYNAIGQVTGQGVLRGSRHSIDTRQLAGGLYFLQFRIGNQFITRRFIKG